jgi:hypothetical protein
MPPAAHMPISLRITRSPRSRGPVVFKAAPSAFPRTLDLPTSHGKGDHDAAVARFSVSATATCVMWKALKWRDIRLAIFREWLPLMTRFLAATVAV